MNPLIGDTNRASIKNIFPDGASHLGTNERDTMTILTDAHGRPFARPEIPERDAPIEERIAYIRAVHEYNDKVTDSANKAFARAFGKSARE